MPTVEEKKATLAELKVQRAAKRRNFTRVSNKITDVVLHGSPSSTDVEKVQSALVMMGDTLKEAK